MPLSQGKAWGSQLSLETAASWPVVLFSQSIISQLTNSSRSASAQIASSPFKRENGAMGERWGLVEVWKSGSIWREIGARDTEIYTVWPHLFCGSWKCMSKPGCRETAARFTSAIMVVEKGGGFWWYSYKLFLHICKMTLIIITLNSRLNRSCGVRL